MTKRFIKGTIKEKQTQYGSLYIIKINKDDINQLPVDKYGNFNLTMLQRKEPSQYGDTHYLIEDTYHIEKQKQKSGIQDVFSEDNELPF